MKIMSGIAALAVVVMMGGGRASADIVTNGSFETGPTVPNPPGYTTLSGGSTAITGWTVTGDSVDYIGSYWQASNGSYSLDLSGNAPGGVSQVLSTTVGTSYTVQFDLAGNPDGPPTTKTLTVSAGATASPYSFTVTPADTHTSMGWVTDTFVFTATSTMTTLAFTSTTAGFFGPALDNVRVNPTATAVPEPSTIPLCVAGGIIGLAAAWRRRERA
jgi:choice-of-anchor C domain-containing protein